MIDQTTLIAGLVAALDTDSLHLQSLASDLRGLAEMLKDTKDPEAIGHYLARYAIRADRRAKIINQLVKAAEETRS